MSRTHIKNFSLAFTAVALALSLTACSGSGPNAATRLVKKVTDGAEIMIKSDGNNISVTNLLLVATEDGSAVVVGTIINYSEERDALLGISANNVGAVITGEQNLDQNKPVRFEGDVATTKAVFNGVGAEAGKNVKLSLAFARAGVVTANVIIRDKRDDYKNITP
jgi:hypothetical protein